MKILQKICLVLLLGTISSVYGGSCFDGDINTCLRESDQGDSSAQYNLGVMYYNGQGVIYQDYKEAVKWWRKSAEQGVHESQKSLGDMYYNGEGVVQDYKESFKWYRKSAKQGNSEAQKSLGDMCYDGIGVLQDYKEAVKWYKKSAEQGNSKSQFSLGNLYYNSHDNVMAHMYWNIAAVSEHKDAIKNRDLIAKEMTPSQIQESQDLAREWMRTHQ